jgi:hypothetical protein
MALRSALEQVPDRDVRNLDAALGQFIGERSCRDVGLCCDASQYPITLILENAWPMSAHLGRCDATGFAIALHQTDYGRIADTELPGCGPTRHAAFDGAHETDTKIMVERLCHGCWPPSPATMVNHCSPQKGIPNDSVKSERALATIPSIGLIGATAFTATITDPSTFKSSRDLAAWIGLVPRQNSTGGKERLGRITKQGDRYLRCLLVAGAMAVVQQARRHPEKYPWIARLLARKPAKLVAIAIANKTARIAWAVMTRGEIYRSPVLLAAA